MKSNVFFRLIIIFLAVVCLAYKAVSAPVPETAAEEFVLQTGYKLIETLGNKNSQEKYETLDQMFYENVDVSYLAKFVIGKYWRHMNDTQKQAYMDLFPRYVVNVYKNFPLDFGTDGLSLDVLSGNINGEFTDVRCRINLPEQLRADTFQNINVSFKLTQNNNQIQIVDLKIGESSLLVSYRNRFYKMVQDVDEDMVWFLEDFAELTASAEKNAAERLLYN